MSFHRNTRLAHKGLRHLSNDNVRRILSICDADHSKRDLGDMVRIIANTGSRLGELRNLRWSSVDLPNNRLVLDSPKSRCERCVPFGAKTCRSLNERQDREPASEFVFGDAREGLVNRATRQFHIVADKLGVGPVSFNALRHTFLLNLANSGADSLALLYIGGWRPNTSMKSFMIPAQACKCAASELARVEEF